MRLWHYDLLEVLPNPQLVSQKRECDMILKLYLLQNERKVKSNIIDYVYKYPLYDTFIYYYKLMLLFKSKNYNFGMTYMNILLDKYNFKFDSKYKPYKDHHNYLYLTICYYNLYEKYLRNQKHFDIETWNNINKLYKKKFKYCIINYKLGGLNNDLEK